MKFYEIRVTLFFKQDIQFKNFNERISKYVNFCMNHHSELKDYHCNGEIKLYGFSAPNPYEMDKLYKTNRIYQVRLRTPLYKLAEPFTKLMNWIENDDFKPLGCQMEIREPKFIEQIETTTPAVVTLGTKYWTKEDGIDLLYEKINKNLLKKYCVLTGETIDKTHNAISYLEVKNERPIIINYKQGAIFGHKLIVGFKPDEVSQKLAGTAVATGLLEKNSLGAGFCLYNKRR